jgi:hypothetical protein
MEGFIMKANRFKAIYVVLAALALTSCAGDIKEPAVPDLQGTWQLVLTRDTDITINVKGDKLIPSPKSKNAQARMEALGNKVPDDLKGMQLVFKGEKITTLQKGKKADERGFGLRRREGKTFIVIEPGIQQAHIFIEEGRLHMHDEINNADAIWEKD